MTYYEVLGVLPTANKEQILSAFRRLAKEYHPDRNKSPDASKKFVEIYEAYKILSDDNKRKIYDKTTFVDNQETSNKEYEDFVKKAQQEGDIFAKQKYSKAIYNILCSVKKGLFQTVGFILYTVLYLALNLLFRYGPIALILLIIYGIAMCSINIRDTSVQNERQKQYYDLFSNLNSYNQAFPVEHENYSLKDKKILIIENENISNIFYKISDYYRPINDVEIDYILKCESNLVKVGKYSDGAIGYRKDYKIYVIDYNKHKEVGVFEAIGNNPPSSKKNGGDRIGSDTLLSTINRLIGEY